MAREAGTNRRDSLVQAARHALKTGRFRGRRAISALGLSEVSTRHIRISAQDGFAEELLAKEISDQPIAGHGSELSFCSVPVAEIVDQGKTKREYLCCIAESKVIAEHISLLDSMGLQPMAIDLETVAAARAFPSAPDSESLYLYVDIGFHSTRLTVIKGTAPLLMRTVPVGSSDMMRVLSERLDLDLDAILELAEEERERQVDLLVESSVVSVLSNQLNLILHRIDSCIRYCASLFQGRSVSAIRLLGGAAALPGLAQFIRRRIGMKAEVADAFAALNLTPDQEVHAPLPTFTTALGLAVRGLDA